MAKYSTPGRYVSSLQSFFHLQISEYESLITNIILPNFGDKAITIPLPQHAGMLCCDQQVATSRAFVFAKIISSSVHRAELMVLHDKRCSSVCRCPQTQVSSSPSKPHITMLALKPSTKHNLSPRHHGFQSVRGFP